MIPAAHAAKAAALLLALAAHGALVWALARPEAPQIAGGSGAAEVRLGAAFADMSAGTLTAAPPPEITRAAPAAPLPAVRPAERLAAPPPAPTAPPRPTTQAPTIPVETLPAVPAAPTEAAPPPPPEVVAATDPDSAAPLRSARPQPRRPDLAQRRPAPQAASPVGNAPRTATSGVATGRETARARDGGAGGQNQAAGNAAASSYPGQVMSRIARVGKPRVRARGTALVAFTIAGNGGLAQLSLARSSGSEALDRAALQLVRRAEPFPAPPQGAQRAYSIGITGR